MKIFDKLKEKINNKIKLVQAKVRGKKYVQLQKPVQDMSYGEIAKEFLRKKNALFNQNDGFSGRNFDLIKRYIFEKKDNSFAIDYFVKLLKSEDISLSVKFDFIHSFCQFFDDNELCMIMSMEDEVLDKKYKIQVVEELPERIPEDFILQYFDYTNISIRYVEKIMKCISVDAKIKVLNLISNDEIKQELLRKEVKNLDFEEAKKLYEGTNLYEYKEIEDFYIKEIKTSGMKKALSLLNEMGYISPGLAKVFDKIIKPKGVEEVIEYINDNSVKKGGIIYLTRKFKIEDKKEVFYKLENEEDRLNCLPIFFGDLGKKEFLSMVTNESNQKLKEEMIKKANTLMRTKHFTEKEIENLYSL